MSDLPVSNDLIADITGVKISEDKDNATPDIVAPAKPKSAPASKQLQILSKLHDSAWQHVQQKLERKSETKQAPQKLLAGNIDTKSVLNKAFDIYSDALISAIENGISNEHIDILEHIGELPVDEDLIERILKAGHKAESYTTQENEAEVNVSQCSSDTDNNNSSLEIVQIMPPKASSAKQSSSDEKKQTGTTLKKKTVLSGAQPDAYAKLQEAEPSKPAKIIEQLTKKAKKLQKEEKKQKKRENRETMEIPNSAIEEPELLVKHVKPPKQPATEPEETSKKDQKTIIKPKPEQEVIVIAPPSTTEKPTSGTTQKAHKSKSKADTSKIEASQSDVQRVAPQEAATTKKDSKSKKKAKQVSNEPVQKPDMAQLLEVAMSDEKKPTNDDKKADKQKKEKKEKSKTIASETVVKPPQGTISKNTTDEFLQKLQEKAKKEKSSKRAQNSSEPKNKE